MTGKLGWPDELFGLCGCTCQLLQCLGGHVARGCAARLPCQQLHVPLKVGRRQPATRQDGHRRLDIAATHLTSSRSYLALKKKLVKSTANEKVPGAHRFFLLTDETGASLKKRSSGNQKHRIWLPIDYTERKKKGTLLGVLWLKKVTRHWRQGHLLHDKPLVCFQANVHTRAEPPGGGHFGRSRGRLS